MGQATRWVLPDACPCVKNLYILYIYILSLPLISWWFRTKQITAIWLAGPSLKKSNGISKSNEKRTGFEIAGRVYRCRGSWLKAEAGWRTPAGRANSMARDLPSPCRCGASGGWTEGTPVLADMPSRCGACCRRIAYACKYDRAMDPFVVRMILWAPRGEMTYDGRECVTSLWRKWRCNDISSECTSPHHMPRLDDLALLEEVDIANILMVTIVADMLMAFVMSSTTDLNYY